MSEKNSDSVTRRDTLRSIGAGAATGAVGIFDSLRQLQSFGGGNSGDTHHDLTIEATGNVAYEFTVTGLLSSASAPGDVVESGTATGTLDGERHTFQFTGEFTQFDIDGDADVRVDKRSFDYE